MNNKRIRYVIYKNKVWREVMHKGIPMAIRAVYRGENKKDCQKWLKERNINNE